jgi:hypothetical protein
MTFPIQAPERVSLIPVLSMLLQFNIKEREEVDRAARDPAAAARPVKEIKRSLHRAAASSSSFIHNTTVASAPSPVLTTVGGGAVTIPGTRSEGDAATYVPPSVSSILDQAGPNSPSLVPQTA